MRSRKPTRASVIAIALVSVAVGACSGGGSKGSGDETFEISGFVFEDTNEDLSVADDTGSPAAGQVVYLDENDNWRRDADESSTTSGADGGWVLEVEEGSHMVRLEPGAGWLQAVPGEAMNEVDAFTAAEINTDRWQTRGDGVAQDSGTLQITRNSSEDSIELIERFTGDQSFAFDVSVEESHWNDTFHGLAVGVPCDDGTSMTGVSIGHYHNGDRWFLSQTYCTGSSTMYQPPDSFELATTYQLEVDIVGDRVEVTVDGVEIFDEPFTPDAPYALVLPGVYSDSDGGGSVGNTVSHWDDYSRVGIKREGIEVEVVDDDVTDVILGVFPESP